MLNRSTDRPVATASLPFYYRNMVTPGKLGVYEVVERLGAGGMGEVYRARDPRLKREVAIKIVPVEDPDRRRRFKQEAQAASALKHPNILVIHDIGDENGTSYMVSELVDGASLRQLLQSGPLPARKLLDIAVQIADGLAAAHQAGIVHRDLKPENIMVTPANQVKILDFGLAKLAQTGMEDEETISQALSRTGVLHGTVPYMSPEQASGSRSVDFRSDQFSLGLILYEMATGKRAFPQSSTGELLAAIINSDPQPVSSLNPAVPAPLRWLIERCMSKEPAQRYASTADLHGELRIIREHLSDALLLPEQKRPVVSRARAWKQAAIVLAVLIAGALAGWKFAGRNHAQALPGSITRLAVGSDIWGPVAWSPDGNMIAYVAAVNGVKNVFTLDLKSLASTQITNLTSDCQRVLYSADGSRLYYISGGEPPDLWVVSATGGPSDVLLRNVSSPAYSGKANAMAFLRKINGHNALFISSPPGAQPAKFDHVPAGAKDFLDSVISFSPDGSKIGAWVASREGVAFWILPFPAGKPHQVSVPKEREGAFYSWMPDSRHLVFGAATAHLGGGNLLQLDAEDGSSRLLTAGYTSGEMRPSVAPDGSLIAFQTLQDTSDLLQIPLDGSPLRVLAAEVRSPAFSPIGNQYAYAGANGAEGIWLTSPTDHWTRPVVTARDLHVTIFDSPSISPDGQRVAYQADSDQIWVSPASGGGRELLVPAEWTADFPSWSPDGKSIAFLSSANPVSELCRVSAMGTGQPVVIKDGLNYAPVRWSPDGKWITAVSEDGLLLVSPDGKASRFLAKGNWQALTWSKDGRTIYGLKSEDQQVRLYSIDVETGAQKRLNELAAGNSAYYFGLTLSPDGNSLLTSQIENRISIWLLQLSAKRAS